MGLVSTNRKIYDSATTESSTSKKIIQPWQAGLLNKKKKKRVSMSTDEKVDSLMTSLDRRSSSIEHDSQAEDRGPKSNGEMIDSLIALMNKPVIIPRE